MMLYLTGASFSLEKSEVSPQTDPAKSLGGYISSTTVPNGALNVLFDLVSGLTLEKRQDETIAIALINKYDYPVHNVKMKIADYPNDLCRFKVAPVKVDNMTMESIANRYSMPLQADFYSMSFARAAVNVKIDYPANIGEEFLLLPFGVLISGVKFKSIDGTWDAIEESFEENEEYDVIRTSINEFTIRSKGTEKVEDTTCSFATDGEVKLTFETQYKNDYDNEKVIVDVMQPGDVVGLWIKRSIKKVAYPTDRQRLADWKKENKIKEGISLSEFVDTWENYQPIDTSKVEQVDIVIDWEEDAGGGGVNP